MKTSENIGELAKALAQAQGKFTAIPKTEQNPFFKSKYAGLPTVVEVAAPILSELGLSIAQFIGHNEHGDTLTTWLLHESGQFISGEMQLHPIKNDPQGQGSAITYARRYSYMSVLGLVADDDDDGNAGTKAANKPQAKSGNAAALKQAVGQKADPNTGEVIQGDFSGEGPTDGQTKYAMALFKGKELRTDTQQAEFIKSITGREVSGWGDVTKTEASKVVDALKSAS